MLILALSDLNNLETVLESDVKPDAVIIGIEGFALRCSACISIEKAAETAAFFHERGVKVFFNCQAMLCQNRIEEAEKIFKKLLEAEADGIYAGDAGWLELAMEAGRMDLMIWQPETLVCSGQEGKFYQDLGAQAVSLAHELSIEEIAACAGQCSICEILINGYYSWMDSARPLLSNYFTHTHQKDEFESGKLYRIQEMKRTSWLPVYQDQLGTHVLSDVPVSSFQYLRKMKDDGIERMRIDCFLKDNAWGMDALKTAVCALEQKLPSDFNESRIGSSSVYQTETILRKEEQNEQQGQ